MKKLEYNHHQSGIGLIEVLIALLVVSLGLLALTQLQGELLSSSGESKARMEAKSIAEQQIEQDRNTIDLDGDYANVATYRAGIEGTALNVSGTYANYAVSRYVGSEGANDHKTIAVLVSWTNASGEQEEITVSSKLIFKDAASTVMSADASAESGAPAIAPSPNNRSGELGEGNHTPDAGDDYAISESDAGDANYDATLASFSNLKMGYDSEGNRVLYDTADSNAILLKCFGHKILTIRGEVYTVNDLSAIDVNISPYGVCQFGDGTGLSDAPYACFMCGNCSDSWGSEDCYLTSGGTPSSNPTEWDSYNDNGIGAGGWRGKIGLAGVDDDGGSKESVCFNEQVVNTSAGAATAREYATRRVESGVTTSEGINTSYACHNFLIVNRNGPNSDCAAAANDLSAVANFTSQSIIRTLSGSSTADPNTVLPIDTSQCIAAPSTDCSLPWGGTISDTSTVTAYQIDSVVDPAVCVSETRSCSSGTLSGSYQYETCTVAPAGDCTTPWGDIVADGGTVTAYLNETEISSCTSQARVCSNGTLSGSYQYETCTLECDTVVQGKAHNKNDTITVSDGTNTYNCTVENSKNYTCPTITSTPPTGVTITVTSSGTVNTSQNLSVCGTYDVDF